MQIEPVPASASPENNSLPWYKTLTGYQWFVFIVCCLAWDMDCTDQQLFILARRPAMVELVPKVQKDDPRLPELKRQLETKSPKTPTEAEVIAAQQNADIVDAAISQEFLGTGIRRIERVLDGLDEHNPQ